MPTLIRIKESGLKIEKTKGITKISINTLFLEKGLQVADVITTFNESLYNAEQRMNASISAETQLRINADQAFSSYLVDLNTSIDDSFAGVHTSIETLTTNISAVSSSVTALEVTLNGTINVRLEEIAKVFAGAFEYTNTPETPKFGDLKLVGGVTYQYLGGTLGPNTDGWVLYNETALGVANQVSGWVAGSSSLVVNPTTKEVVGWQYGDGSGFDSVFKISADYIELAGTTTFSEFAKTDMSNVTTIDGGKITTNTLDASAITANTITADRIAANAITAEKIKAGEVTADKLAVMGLSTFTNDVGYTHFKTFMQETQPEIIEVTAGDLWIDTNDNNKTYRYDGDTWSITNFDAAVAINTGTTTISGAKITTGSITADKINTTGLIAENISATTITGKTINSSTINASTVNLGNLNVINAAGYSVYPVFMNKWNFNTVVGSAGVFTTTITSSIATYNSSNSTRKKLSKPSGNLIYFEWDLQGGIVTINNTDALMLLYSSSQYAPTALNISVYSGATLIASKTSGWVANTLYEIAGFGFMLEGTTYKRVLLRAENPDVSASNLNSTSELKIVVYADFPDATYTYRPSGFYLTSMITNF